MTPTHPLTLFRMRQGLTQVELARRVGCGRWTLCKIEAWQRTPSLDLIRRIKEATNGAVTADDFLDEKVHQ